MEFQWYPGHMTKAVRQMQEDIKIIDLVIELIDARIPYASRNPEIDKLAQNKARLVLLNKKDLSDDTITEEWLAYFAGQNIQAVAIDARDRKCIAKIDAAVEKACEKKRKRDEQRGIKNRPIRAMVVGIPNIGKSTFINSYAKKAAAKTGNKPGVTKGKQWIRLRKNLELLDTPGILWPKFENQAVGLYLAALGAIRNEVLEQRDLACEVLPLLIERYPGRFAEKYNLEETADAAELLRQIAASRNCIKAGGAPDEERAAAMFLDDFKNGRLGKISLERP